MQMAHLLLLLLLVNTSYESERQDDNKQQQQRSNQKLFVNNQPSPISYRWYNSPFYFSLSTTVHESQRQKMTTNKQQQQLLQLYRRTFWLLMITPIFCQGISVKKLPVIYICSFHSPLTNGKDRPIISIFGCSTNIVVPEVHPRGHRLPVDHCTVLSAMLVVGLIRVPSA